MAEKKESFFRPFEALGKLRDSLPAGPAPVRNRKRKQIAATERAATSRAPEPALPFVSDELLYERAMAKVTPLERADAPLPAAALKEVKIGQIRSVEELDYSQFSEWVSGNGPFELVNSAEYVEGLGPGIDRRLLVRLRKADYAIQAHLDLHGLNADEAHAEVDRFIDAARENGKRCVLIIHGRGLNSKDHTPILKERLIGWLTRTRLARDVLAFCSARPEDGGTGAIYILIRRT